jgi:hypothetical protein
LLTQFAGEKVQAIVADKVVIIHSQKQGQSAILRGRETNHPFTKTLISEIRLEPDSSLPRFRVIAIDSIRQRTFSSSGTLAEIL